jgi:hypothetical protein
LELVILFHPKTNADDMAAFVGARVGQRLNQI